MADHPTVYIVASDQSRNGKTLLARLIADYLLLDGRDPFLIDTDPPDAPLRSYFPGRTQLANLENVQGQIKIFDTMLTSVGRDYIVDLTSRHIGAFFDQVRDLDFTSELKSRGYRVVIFFIVDSSPESAKAFRLLARTLRADLHLPVRNHFVGSSLPADEAAFDMPRLDDIAVQPVMHRHFSIREFVLGNSQNLDPVADIALKRFIYAVMQAFTDLEPAISLAMAKQR